MSNNKEVMSNNLNEVKVINCTNKDVFFNGVLIKPDAINSIELKTKDGVVYILERAKFFSEENIYRLDIFKLKHIQGGDDAVIIVSPFINECRMALEFLFDEGISVEALRELGDLINSYKYSEIYKYIKNILKANMHLAPRIKRILDEYKMCINVAYGESKSY